MRLSSLTIRRALPADAAALADFALRVFIVTFGPDNNQQDIDDYVTKTYGPELQRREIEDPRVTTLLIESDGALIAFAQMRVAADEVEIARFYVDPPWHGRGVAQQLMQACLDVARDAGVPRVWLAVWEKNARAIAFYEKCGFRFTGSQLFILGKDVQTDRLMEMNIPDVTSSRR